MGNYQLLLVAECFSVSAAVMNFVTVMWKNEKYKSHVVAITVTLYIIVVTLFVAYYILNGWSFTPNLNY